MVKGRRDLGRPQRECRYAGGTIVALVIVVVAGTQERPTHRVSRRASWVDMTWL
jgi:hypothetical protein